MSLDFNFNKSLSAKEIEENTSLKVVLNNSVEYLRDQYDNVVCFKGYGITLYGAPRNPWKIFDELIRAFDVMFIDDSAMDKLYYEPEKYNAEDLFLETMNKYGYVIDGKIIVPKRTEEDYLPYSPREDNGGEIDDELPF